jgi:septal ring factor EnvC (AmiA/AmiB activator)
MEDQLNTFFKHSDFDIEVPRTGHLERFQDRINNQNKKSHKVTSFKWMSLAASVLLFVGFWFGKNHTENTMFLADVSPKMEEAETFFISTIQQELKAVEKMRSTETERVIEDALNQIEGLEDKYKELISELNHSNSDRRVVYAMISNYQNRIEILQNVLKQIDQINNSKENKDEKSYL